MIYTEKHEIYLDYSGRRISDLSGLFTQGQFSIFYMSTYQTDFILVKPHTTITSIRLESQVITLRFR